VVPVLQRVLSWDPATGAPVTKSVAVFTQKQVGEIISAAAASMYLGPELEYVGWTNLEVMIHKRVRYAAQGGDSKDIDGVLDRIAGKPKTSAEITHRSMSYDERLKKIEEAETVDVEVDAPAPGRDLLDDVL